MLSKNFTVLFVYGNSYMQFSSYNYNVEVVLWQFVYISH